MIVRVLKDEEEQEISNILGEVTTSSTHFPSASPIDAWGEGIDAPKTFAGVQLGWRDLGGSSSLLFWKIWQNVLIKSDE